jgi:hypothetical protein
MKAQLATVFTLAFVLVLGSPSFGRQTAAQSGPADNATAQSAKKHKGSKSAGKEVGDGGKDIGKGAGKGAESMGKGTAKAAGDLATLHPVDAGASLGKGAAGLGKDVGVGTTKGGTKIAKGTGKGVGKLGKKIVHHDKKSPPEQ